MPSLKRSVVSLLSSWQVLVLFETTLLLFGIIICCSNSYVLTSQQQQQRRRSYHRLSYTSSKNYRSDKQQGWSSRILLQAAKRDTNSNSSNNSGEVGSGRNWIERSFPINDNEKVDPKKVDDYNLGIDGESLGIGPLSKRMYNAIYERSSIPNKETDYEIQRAFKLYAMDFTAKEAVRAALKQNGLELSLSEDEQDEGMWGDVDSIRIEGNDNILYDSWEDVIDDNVWEPGQSFSFIVRQVPAKMRELTLDELLQALDPDGSLRTQAKDSGMIMPDEEIDSLYAMATNNIRRTEMAPRDVNEENPFAGTDAAGYRVIAASDLMETDSNGITPVSTLMHVMDALVSHGCLIVDLTDGDKQYDMAIQFSKMWNAVTDLFRYVDESKDFILPGLATADGVGSTYAKVGFANYDNGNLQFLETRQTRSDGQLLPKQLEQVIGIDGCNALQSSFNIVTTLGKHVTRIVVAASTEEADGVILDPIEATKAATKLANELLDDGKSLPNDITIKHSEGPVSMSPHRLCRYTNNKKTKDEENLSNKDDENEIKTTMSLSKEIFGAHTDSTFITAVPVAAVAGLEVFDDDADQWYRPELAARRHYRAIQASKGNDPDALVETINYDEQEVELSWYSRYIILMPGELLQLSSRDEVLASVHRVIAVQNGPSRLSTPILLRGRPGIKFDCNRYLGGIGSSYPILQECDGMTIEDIHDAMQPKSFQ